ncbi:MAG: FG-GAP-like repeat-containing protein, partial [Pyrinomonadaceae bacterium]
MKKKTFRIYIFLSAVLFGVCVAKSQTLKADYQFQGNLNSSVAGAPALTNLTGSGGANSFALDIVDGYSRQTLRFPFNSGVSVNITGLIPLNTYTMVGLFRFDQVSGRRRVGGSDPADNDGAYILDGRLEGETTANAPFHQNTYIQVVVVRETNGTVRAYRDGTLRVTAPDPDGDFAFDTGLLRLFQDDTNLPTEASAGNVARIRLYDEPMSTAQVQALDRTANALGGGEQPILFSSLRDGIREIYSMNADGGNQRRLTNNGVTDLGARWSPNGQKIVYYSGPTPQIWVMNADGSGQTRLTNTATADQRPFWRPDGSKILFSRCASGICDLWTMNPDGTGQAALPSPMNTANDEDAGAYSPDGTKITFICSGASFANQNICTANADGSNRQQITNTLSPVRNDDPAYSPNGATIAFSRLSNSASSLTGEIYVMASVGGSEIRLTNDAFTSVTPIWSPAGTRLAYGTAIEGFTAEIYLINSSNGGELARLTVNSVNDAVSDWFRVALANRTPFDYDGDGKADLSVMRPTNNFWYLQRSQLGYTFEEWGVAGDILAPADYDGDGKTELGIFRPSTGTWYWFNIVTRSIRVVRWGEAGDIPVPADHDGDGKADFVLYRPSNGTWYKRLSTSDGITYQTTFATFQFGTVEDKPQIGDFDGDGKADLALFHPSNGV